MQATEISDASRATALLIADAIPLRAGSTAIRMASKRFMRKNL